MASTTEEHHDEHSSTHDSHDDHHSTEDSHDHDEEDHEYHTEDVWLAILLVIMAGLMISIGGMLSFLIPRSYGKVLPIALAFSAGVLIYLAFIEVWPACESGFDSTGDEEWEVHIYTSLTFFGGILLGAVLDQIVHMLGHEHDHHHSHHGNEMQTASAEAARDVDRKQGHDARDAIGAASMSNDASGDGGGGSGSGGGGTDVGQMAAETGGAPAEADLDGDGRSTVDLGEAPKERERVVSYGGKRLSVVEQKQMMRVSFATAIAVSLHNLPEGLATFIGTIADPAIGFSIAIAVAIHNIPLGISIATPVYVVTESKWKAVGTASLAAISQPIGGLIGLIFIESGVSDVSFAVMFGLTGGLMIYTCFRELLPAARYEDPHDKYTSWLVFIGMVVLDFSLILFDSSGGHEHRRRFL